MLRERGGGEEVGWDRIIAYCLQGEKGTLDEAALSALLEALGDPARFARLVEQLQHTTGDGTKVGIRVAALLALMRTAIEAARRQGEAEVDRAFETIATSFCRLTPEMMIAVLERRHAGSRDEATLVAAVTDRMTDSAMASFMARAVAADRQGNERLAQAMETLAPSTDRKRRVVELAKAEALESELGAEPGFEQMWQDVSNIVMSYSLVSHAKSSFIPEDYGRELSASRKQAIEVERVSDDPPDRVHAWLATVSEPAVAQLDLEMLLDLLRIEGELAHWEPIATIAASEAERRTARRRRRRSSFLGRSVGARDEGRRPPGAASRSDEARGPPRRGLACTTCRCPLPDRP